MKPQPRLGDKPFTTPHRLHVPDITAIEYEIASRRAKRIGNKILTGVFLALAALVIAGVWWCVGDEIKQILEI